MEMEEQSLVNNIGYAMQTQWDNRVDSDLWVLPPHLPLSFVDFSSDSSILVTSPLSKIFQVVSRKVKVSFLFLNLSDQAITIFLQDKDQEVC